MKKHVVLFEGFEQTDPDDLIISAEEKWGTIHLIDCVLGGYTTPVIVCGGEELAHRLSMDFYDEVLASYEGPMPKYVNSNLIFNDTEMEENEIFTVVEIIRRSVGKHRLNQALETLVNQGYVTLYSQDDMEDFRYQIRNRPPW